MAYTPIAASTTQLQIPGGRIEFALLDETEVSKGFTDFGIVNTFTVTIASEVLPKKASRAGQSVLVGSQTISITRTANLAIAQFSLDNLALWFAATKVIQSQTGGAVTNEDHVIEKVDAYYQLGASASNPSGVRSVTSTTFAIKEGELADGWVTETVTALGDFVKEASNPTHYFEATSIGSTPFKTGTNEPTWNTTLGATTTDGDITWTCRGLITPVATTDYVLDATRARVFIPLTSRIIVGHSLRVDYTKSAVQRETLKTGASISNTIAVKVISVPIAGTPRDYLFPKCTLAPTGDLTLYAEDPAYNSMTFDLSILDPSPGPSGEVIEAIYIDGLPVAT